MPKPVEDEPVYFYEWRPATSDHKLYDATIRVLLTTGRNELHPRAHLVVLRQDESFENVNNVDNVEEEDDVTGKNYWKKRYGTWPPV